VVRVNELLTWPVGLLAALVVAATIGAWLRRRARRHQQQLRRQGWRLIRELNAYSAWIEALRGDPLLAADAEASAAAQALRNARAITQSAFAPLAPAMLRLSATDERLLAYLSQLDQPGAPPAPAMQRDPEYRQWHEEQEDLIQEIIARCQVLMGEHHGVWRATDMDTEFAPSFSLRTSSSR
jgi:hypothetical protein